METSPLEKQPRSKRDKTKQAEPFTSAILVAFVFAMVVAVALRLGRHGNQGTCSFDAANQKASCKGKDLTAVPSDIPDSVVVLHMGDTLDTQGENHFPVLQRGNFTRFRNLRELVLVRCDIENVSEEPFADLAELRRLDLRFNRIRTLSDSSFRGLSDLEYLLLSNNPIQVLDDNVFQGLRIDHLDFANNPVLWKITPKAFHESSIVRLTFTRCNLKSIKSETWAPLASSLRRLQISDNLQPLDVKEDAFRGFHLEQIVLINDGITSVAFLKHGEYEQITLDRNPLESIKFWHNDRQSKKKPQKITKHLSLSGAKISKVSQDTFSVFSGLEILNLSSNNLALVNAEVFEDLEQLRILDLSENDVVEFVGNFSKVLPHLETLLLNGNEVQTIPASMEQFFSRLSNISLGGNPFHCNCEVRWLLHWLEGNSEKHRETANASPIACRSPETKNFSQVSEYDLRCRAPTILNATIDIDGMTLVCTADGDPAPAVTWLGPFGEETTVEPSSAKRDIFQTDGRMTMVKDGNYTCRAVNLIAMDSVVVDTNSIPLNGLKFFNESQQRLRILESPQGLLATVALLGILGYVLRRQ